MSEPTFALLQARHERIDSAILRQVLMQEGGMPRFDALRASQKCRGIITDRLTRQQADACRLSLLRHGVETFVLPTEQFATHVRPVAVHWIGVGPSGLFVPTDYHGASVVVPWSSVFVVSSGLVMTVIEDRVPKEVWDATSHESISTTKWESRRKEELHHITEILGLTQAGQVQHFRLAAQRLHMQQVPHGGAAATRFQKYLLLLDDIVAGATQAEVSPETRLILTERRERPREIEGKKSYVFDERGFDDYNRWLLQLFMHREAASSQEVTPGSSETPGPDR